MEPEYVERSKIVGLMCFVLGVIGVAIISVFISSLGCTFGGSKWQCILTGRVLITFLVVNIVFVLYVVKALFKNTLTKRGLKILLWIHASSIFFAVIGFFLVAEGGLLQSVLKGTEMECRVYSGSTRSYCYSELAKKTNNVSYCKKTEMFTGCYTYFAEKDRDPSLCPNTDFQCLMSVARKEKNPEICTRIELDRLRIDCLQQEELYLANSIRFEFLPTTRTIFKKGEKNAELAKLKISVSGGYARISRLSFLDDTTHYQNKAKIDNIEIHKDGEIVAKYPSVQSINNNNYSGATTYNFWGENFKPFIVSSETPAVVAIKGDIPSTEDFIRFVFDGFNTYPSIQINQEKNSGTEYISSFINFKN